MWPFALVAAAGADQTSVTQFLNEAIATSGLDEVYTGGRGVVIRSLFDGLGDDATKAVVPASFWVNDIDVPSQIYPDVEDFTDDIKTAAYRASVAVVISDLKAFFHEADQMQDSDWSHGVFYATDANSIDSRCFLLDDFQIYDCPGGSINSDGTFESDVTKIGSGAYNGSGCHFSFRQEKIDQENGVEGELLSDSHGQCNYNYRGNWTAWVDSWLKVDPSAGVDRAACWINNVRDLIGLQNAIYRGGAFLTTAPTEYWGWNEIPVKRLVVADPANWDAVMIHVPVAVCGAGLDSVQCLSHPNMRRLESTLQKYVDARYLIPGYDQIAYRPGSSVVFAREWNDGTGRWFRWFFCENWSSPSGLYQTAFYEMQADDNGACYIDYGTQLSV